MITTILATSLLLSAKPTSGIVAYTMEQCVQSLEIAQEQLEAKEKKEEYLKEQIRLVVMQALDDLETDFHGYTYISSDRKKVVNTAQSLEGNIVYQWGGKAKHSGWNDNWNNRVTDNSTELQGLDCSGFVAWVYKTAIDRDVGTSTAELSQKWTTIDYTDLKPGDIGLIREGGSNEESTNHVGIYVGKDEYGKDLWCDCNADDNTVVTKNAKCFRIYKRILER